MTEKNQEGTLEKALENLHFEDKSDCKRTVCVPPRRRSQGSSDSTKASGLDSNPEERVKLFEHESHPATKCKDEDRRVAEDMDKPSTITDQHFIWAYSPLSKEQQSICLDDEIGKTKTGGKWLLFTDMKTKDKSGLTELDYVWHKVKKMTQNGEFYCSKTTTAMESDVRVNKNCGVIMIYTKDYEDIEDVIETAQKIDSNFELLTPIRYKTNEASREGKYRTEGGKHISLYSYQNGKLCKRHQNGRMFPVSTRKN